MDGPESERRASCRPIGRVECVREGVVERREQVAVAVECDGDAGVPEPLLDGLGVSALGDQQRRVRVAEIVESHAVEVLGSVWRTVGLKMRW